MKKQKVLNDWELEKSESYPGLPAISMERSLLMKVQRIAEKDFPRECCGFLVGRPGDSLIRVSQVIPSADSERSVSSYFISAAALRSIQRGLQNSDLEIVGFFHSHPHASAQPSQTDLQNAWPWYSYLIVSVRAGKTKEVLSWRLRDDRTGFQPQCLVITGKDTK